MENIEEEKNEEKKEDKKEGKNEDKNEGKNEDKNEGKNEDSKEDEQKVQKNNLNLETEIQYSKASFPNTKNLSMYRYREIRDICFTAIENNKNELANYCCEKIKAQFGGQWFVYIENENEANNSEFSFSNKDFEDIIKFEYKKKIIFVLDIK